MIVYTKSLTLPPRDLAGLLFNLGNAYSELANGASDPGKNAQYLNSAADAYDQEVNIFAAQLANQDYCVPCATSPLIDLGIAWNTLGQRTIVPSKSVDYFEKALDVFNKAGKLNGRDDTIGWSDVNANLGQTMLNLAKRTSEPRKRERLNSALNYFEEARKGYTLQFNAQQWADVRAYIATTYLLLGNSTAALELSNSLLQTFPDNKGAYSSKLAVLHDGLFDYEQAFQLNKVWLDKHPEDSTAQFDLAEKYFTTGKFQESIRAINILLNGPYTYGEIRTALRAIEIACLFTAQPEDVPGKLDELIDEVRRQPANFRVNWMFRGTRHFIGESKDLAERREWLLKLFEAIENDDRDTMVKDLNDLRMKVKK